MSCALGIVYSKFFFVRKKFFAQLVSKSKLVTITCKIQVFCNQSNKSVSLLTYGDNPVQTKGSDKNSERFL